MEVKGLRNEMKLRRPSIVATLLWAFGIFIICLTVYSMISWRGWIENLRDMLLVFVAFSSGVNAIATGVLIDMHTVRYKQRNSTATK
jgi:hypothetical protein